MERNPEQRSAPIRNGCRTAAFGAAWNPAGRGRRITDHACADDRAARWLLRHCAAITNPWGRVGPGHPGRAIKCSVQDKILFKNNYLSYFILASKHAIRITSTSLVAAVLTAMSAQQSAQAQTVERADRVIRAIVPFSTGGTNDITARMIAPYLSKVMGQAVAIENRPGAAGNIGIEAVAKSAPDGHTLLFSATASTQNPALYRNLRYDPITDIQPVAAIATYPYAIVVNAHLPAKNRA